MKGIREPNEKELSALSGDIELLFNEPSREIPSTCPVCGEKLIRSKKRQEYVIGTKIHVRNLMCKQCNYGLMVEE